MPSDTGTSNGGNSGNRMLPPFFLRFRARLGELWWWSLLFFAVQRLGDAVNFAVGVWLVPKFVPADELGAVLPLMSVAGFVAFPIAVLLLPVGKFLNVFASRGEYGKARALLEDAALASIAAAAAIGVWLHASGDGILLRLHLTDRRLFVPMAGFAVVACFEPLVQSAMKSLKCFGAVFAVSLFSPWVRLAAMLLLLPGLGALGYLAGQLMPSVFSLSVGAAALVAALRHRGARRTWLPHWREMVAYAAPLLAITLASRVQAPVETFVIRHRLPGDVSAGYYFANVFGAVPGYLASAMMVVLFPMISERHERGESTGAMLWQSMAVNMVLGLAATAVMAAVAPFLFRLRGPWSGYEAYSRFVWQVGLVAVMKNAQAIFMTHESACRSFRYVWYLVPLYLLEAATLYILPAWSFARPWMPDALWRFVDARWTLSLQGLVTPIVLFNALFLLSMLLDWHLRKPGRR